MRKLSTAVGCLVIAAYATVGQAAMHHDDDGSLIAKCQFGHEGYVIFRQTPPRLSRRKRNLLQYDPEEEDLEEEVEADYEEDGALVERRGRFNYSDSDNEYDRLSYSDDEHYEEDEDEETAEAEALERGGKKVNISCTYEE
jgi:hypothetical protein